MGSFDGDFFGESVWSVILLFFGIICVLSCICFCCPWCPWYKSRRHGSQGTVYQNITLPPGGLNPVSNQNTTPYPVTVQVNHTAPSMAYPVQQMAYPVQQVQPNIAAYQGPATNYGPAMPPQVPSYGLPPPYSEVANLPTAPGPYTQEAYSKQAPFNPYYGPDNH